jgi:hypothetical protein
LNGFNRIDVIQNLSPTQVTVRVHDIVNSFSSKKVQDIVNTC